MPNDDPTYCCEAMQAQLTHFCKRYEDAGRIDSEHPLVTREKDGKFTMWGRKRQHYWIEFCPWCGSPASTFRQAPPEIAPDITP